MTCTRFRQTVEEKMSGLTGLFNYNNLVREYITYNKIAQTHTNHMIEVRLSPEIVGNPVPGNVPRRPVR